MALQVLDKVAAAITAKDDKAPLHLEQLLDFFKGFVDRCHHGKEEDALFPELERRGVKRDGTCSMAVTSKRRARREMKTVGAMIAIHCRGNHGTERELCAECLALWEYAQQRVERCPLLSDKPTCVKCPVHCYKPAMRTQIRVVMRYAGPQMVWRHPILSFFHLINGRLKARVRPKP